MSVLVFAGPITATIFGYGKFSDRDVLMTQYGLMAYSWGLLGFSLVKVLAPGYFARQDTKTPVKIAIGVLAVTQLLNAALVPSIGQAGLSLSIVRSRCVTCTLPPRRQVRLRPE